MLMLLLSLLGVIALLALPVASIALTAIIARVALDSFETRPTWTVVVCIVVLLLGSFFAIGMITSSFGGY